MKLFSRRSIIWAAVLHGLLLVSAEAVSGESAEGDAGEGIRTFTCALDRRELVDVDPNDALAAFTVWGQELGDLYNASYKAIFFESSEELIRLLRKGTIDLAHTSVMTYFQIREAVHVEPLMGEITGGSLGRKFLVLVRADGPITELAGLKGRRMAVRSNDQLGMLFVNDRLLKAHFPEADHFFSHLDEKRKYSQTVMSLFFKQADACLVPEDLFRTMIELNPQLGRDLKVLVESPRLLDKVVFVPGEVKEDLRDTIVKLGETLPKSPRSSQMFMLLRVEGLSRISDSDLEPVRSLVEEYARLKNRPVASVYGGMIPMPNSQAPEKMGRR
jgi:ABC-type phosphate/phosphonate transport system substrate-binding protein